MSASPTSPVAERYRLVSPLGAGGMGRVWLGYDEVLRRDVAVKEVVPPQGLTAAEKDMSNERSLREARNIARLNHPNVVRIYDVVSKEPWPWIIMEYVPSRSLYQAIGEDGPLPPTEVARIGLAVLAALFSAHRAGIVHRDVKPSNVLLSGQRVVLTDWGLATMEGDATVTRTGMIIGSPAYISPERARDGTYTPGSDLWSLGATLYAAVEGRAPYERSSAIATLTALATEDPDPPIHAGPLRPVLDGLLAKDPAHRMNPFEAEHALRRVLGRPKAKPKTPPWRAPRPRVSADALRSAAAAGSAASAAAPESPVAGSPTNDATAIVATPPARPRFAPQPRVHGPGGPQPAPSSAALTHVVTPERGAAAPETAAEPTPEAPAAPGVQSEEPPPESNGNWGRNWNGTWSRRRLVLVAIAIAIMLVGGIAIAFALSGNHAPARARSASLPTGAPGGASTPAGATAGAGAQPSASAPPAQPSLGPGGPLPVGWHYYRDSTGFTVAVPEGWSSYRRDGIVYFRDATGSRLLGVDQTNQPKTNPVADWTTQETRRVAAGDFPGYQSLGIRSVAYHVKAADWEFTYNNHGVRVHVLNRGAVFGDHQAYGIYWSTPDTDWVANLPSLELVTATFQGRAA